MIVGGLAISTLLTLFVIPIFYILLDRLTVKLTGKSTAEGLIRAHEIEREVSKDERLMAPVGGGK